MVLSPLFAAFLITLYVIVRDCGVSSAARNIKYVRIGEKLELSCRLPLDKYYNSSVRWSRNSTVLSHSSINAETLDGKFTTFIDAGNALKLANLQRNNSGIYTCTFSERRDPFKNQITVLVGISPDKPRNLSCTTDHSLSFMTCCWDVGRFPGISSNFSLNYFSRKKSAFYLLFDEDEYTEGHSGTCNVMISKSFTNFLHRVPRQCCQIDVDILTDQKGVITEFVMQMSSANALGVNISSNITEKPSAWIKPSPPFDLKMDIVNSSTGYVVKAHWMKPNMTIDDFEYQIRYRVMEGEFWQVHDRIMKNEYQFDMNRSHSVLEMLVAARPINDCSGYWSDWSKAAFNSTGISKPSPKMKYESIMCDVTNNTFSLDIKWLPYVRQDEPEFRNEIMVKSCKKNVVLANKFTEDSGVHFTLNFTDCIVILGSYCNSQGCSVQTSKTILPQYAPKSKVKNLQMQLNDSGFSLTWSSERLLKHRKCLIRILEMQRSYSKCLSPTSKILKQMEVSCNSNQSFLPIIPSPCLGYTAKVSTMSSSDDAAYTLTVETECISISDPTIPAFNKLHVEDISADRTMFLVKWSNNNSRNCTNLLPRILYRPGENQKCLSNSSLCNEIMISKPLDCNTLSTRVLVNLSYDRYNVEGVMCCRNDLHQELPKCFFPNQRTVITLQVHTFEYHQHVSVGVLVVAILGIVLIISVMTIIYYRKKYIKDVLLKPLWPKIPRPVIFIELLENPMYSDHQAAAVDGARLNSNSDVTDFHSAVDCYSQRSQNGAATVEEYDDLQLPLIQKNTEEGTGVTNFPQQNQETEKSNFVHSVGQSVQGVCSTPMMDDKSEVDEQLSQVCYSFLASQDSASNHSRLPPSFASHNPANKSLKYYSLEHQPTTNADNTEYSKFFGSTSFIPSYLSCCEPSSDAYSSMGRRFSDQSLLPNYTSTAISYSEGPGIVCHLQISTQNEELQTSLSHQQDTADCITATTRNDVAYCEIKDDGIATEEKDLKEFTKNRL